MPTLGRHQDHEARLRGATRVLMRAEAANRCTTRGMNLFVVTVSEPRASDVLFADTRKALGQIACTVRRRANRKRRDAQFSDARVTPACTITVTRKRA